jgi:DNA-binding MarR family transcriptional regulator
MVERLVEARILTREPNPLDRRAVIVKVKPETEKLIDPLERQALKSLVSLIDRLDPKFANYWHEVNLQISAVLE